MAVIPKVGSRLEFCKGLMLKIIPGAVRHWGSMICNSVCVGAHPLVKRYPSARLAVSCEGASGAACRPAQQPDGRYAHGRCRQSDASQPGHL